MSVAERTPIIFVHYGPSVYLRRTLRAARRSNPGKEIYFLGDESNRRFCPHGVTFVPFAAFSDGPKLQTFRTVFQPLEGKRHHFSKHGGTARWLAFVFERWFILEAFVAERRIGRFWTFDSDTMIAADLASREPRFAAYQATEQCRGNCLNGLVNETALIGAYTEWMTSLFRSKNFLEEQRVRLRENEGLCFNEMDAWKDFRDARSPAVCPLGVPREDEVFDDALGIISGWVPAPRKVEDRIPIKKVAIDRRGAAFAFHGNQAAPVRLVTLNLSWLPDYMFDRVARACAPLGTLVYCESACEVLDVNRPPLRAFAAALGKYVPR